jgi:hypothetical protein
LNRDQNGKDKVLTNQYLCQDGLLIALSTVVLTIKTSASSEACIVEHPLSTCLLLGMLITFYLYSEFARNSSFFDLKGVYSVNSILTPTVVPVRLRYVISLVE